MEAEERLVLEWKKRHKRKQTRPRSICESDVGDGSIESKLREQSTFQEQTSEDFTDALDEESKPKTTTFEGQSPRQIKQKPLCSKLCIRKERRVQVPGKRKEPSLTSEEITDIINATNENTSSPCTTNRYRRHFLKQLRKAEAKRCKDSVENEHDRSSISDSLPCSKIEHGKESDKEESCSINDEIENEDNVIEGKRIKVDKAKKRDVYECKVCQKKFNTTGLFMAHYICHSSFEKEHSGLETDKKDEDGSKAVQESGKATDKKSANSSDYNEDSTYFCHVCNERFNNIITLQSHMESHPDEKDACNDGKREFYCNLCHKKFASAGSLHVHNKIHTGDNPYTCFKCNKSFRDKTRLTTHIRVHTGEKPFKCSVCAKSFSQKGNLKLHQKIHSGVRDCLCKICGSCFRLKSDLVRHMKVHAAFDLLESRSRSSSGQELSADDNQTSYSSSDDVLEQSVRESVAWISAGATKTGDESGMQNALDALRSSLSNRTNNSSAKGPMRVDMPRKDVLPGFKPEEKHLMMSIDSEVEFIRAMTSAKLRSNEENTSQRITCPLCGIVFTSIDNLNHHVLMQHNPLNTFGSSFPPFEVRGHDLQRPQEKQLFKCKECIMTFPSISELDKHMTSHSSSFIETGMYSSPVPAEDVPEQLNTQAGDKVYSCAMCNKVFRRSHHLQTHLRTHTGDRPYICADCGKCFVRGDHLQNHRRTHTGEKPYTCEVCHKSYSQSHHLLRHKRTHTGERPYKCVLCEKSFSRDHHLKKHMETHKCTIIPGTTNNCRSSPPVRHQPMPKISMVTRSSHRIAQMMSSLATEHSASRLMESMVKKHLLEQEKSNEHAPERTDELTNENTEISQHEEEPMGEEDGKRIDQSLQISDILDDAIPHGPQLPTGLVVDHVIKATQGFLGNVSKQRLRMLQLPESDSRDIPKEHGPLRQDDYQLTKEQIRSNETAYNARISHTFTNNEATHNDRTDTKPTNNDNTYNINNPTNSEPKYNKRTGTMYNETVSKGRNEHARKELDTHKTTIYDTLLNETIFNKTTPKETDNSDMSFYETSRAYSVNEDKETNIKEVGISSIGNLDKKPERKVPMLTLEDIVNQRLREEYNL